ncbi:MAG: nuclear transport factor 2 family protein [Myxococcota bacterium]
MSNPLSAAEEALAHCHIQSLLSLYYQALDVGDFDRLEREVMAEDATWHVVQLATTGRVEASASGRTEVIAWFKKMLSGDVTMSEGTVRHFLNTHVIRVEGDRAFTTSHLLAASTTTMQTLANGFAEAEHVRTKHGWRIRSYKVTEQITDADMEAFKATFGLEFQ